MIEKEVLFLSNNEYCSQNNRDSDISSLVFFLVNEIGCPNNPNVLSKIKNWLKNLKAQSITLNVTYLEREGRLILLGSNTFNLFIEINEDDFVKILEQWKKLCREKPKEIIITKEGDNVTVEGRS